VRELLKLNKYFGKYRWTVVWGVLFLTLSNAFLVWIPILVRQTLDNIEALTTSFDWSGISVFEIIISNEAGWIIGKGILLLLLASALYGFLLFLTRQTLIVASRKIEFDLRNDIFDKLQKLPKSFFDRNKTGDIYVRATEDVARVREYFGPGFMYAINTITRAGIIITIMFIVSKELTYWALLPLPLLSVLAYWMSSFIHTRSNEIQEQYARLAGRAQESFSSIRLIKAFARESFESERFRDESELYRKKKLRLDIVESLFHPMLNLLVGTSIVLVVWQGGLLVMQGIVSIGNIAEFIINVLFLTWPIAALGYTLNLVQRSAASNLRIQKLFDEPEMDTGNTITESFVNIERNQKINIEFRNVSFSYPGANVAALRNVSFKIPFGSRVAFIGRTGAGKTTLMHLLCRVYEPTQGVILINNVPIQNLPLDRLRQIIGYVPQEAFLFSETIRNNIAFGKENASISEVKVAASGAALLDNILEFEKQFDTVLGERGITLSGGQKQRTTIARALIRTPKILILDDSLSAVDTKTESLIVNFINNELPLTSVIQISHRIQSIRESDIIYVIKDGELKEQGKHEQLIQLNGDYASMYRKQLIEQELAEL
jgi:ATP-binding cassette, subfamily B, multidrug efflux pump